MPRVEGSFTGSNVSRNTKNTRNTRTTLPAAFHRTVFFVFLVFLVFLVFPVFLFARIEARSRHLGTGGCPSAYTTNPTSGQILAFLPRWKRFQPLFFSSIGNGRVLANQYREKPPWMSHAVKK